MGDEHLGTRRGTIGIEARLSFSVYGGGSLHAGGHGLNLGRDFCVVDNLGLFE